MTPRCGWPAWTTAAPATYRRPTHLYNWSGHGDGDPPVPRRRRVRPRRARARPRPHGPPPGPPREQHHRPRRQPVARAGGPLPRQGPLAARDGPGHPPDPDPGRRRRRAGEPRRLQGGSRRGPQHPADASERRQPRRDDQRLSPPWHAAGSRRLRQRPSVLLRLPRVELRHRRSAPGRQRRGEVRARRPRRVQPAQAGLRGTGRPHVRLPDPGSGARSRPVAR